MAFDLETAADPGKLRRVKASAMNTKISTSATKPGIGWRGSPMVMAMGSPPGACASRSFRNRGNAYSGRFENRSGKAMSASLVGVVGAPLCKG